MKVLSSQTVIQCLRARVPAHEVFQYDVGPISSEDDQIAICQELRQVAAINPYYAKTFLGQYLRQLERSNVAACEEIFILYCDDDILNSSQLDPSKPDTLGHVVDGRGTTITVTETPRVISGFGTTGHRTWEAALFLLHWLAESHSADRHENEHRDFPDFRRDLPDWTGKTVIELGAGTGLVSLALLKNQASLHFNKLITTDGDEKLVEAIAQRANANNLDVRDLECETLWWGEKNERFACSADIVVAADVTYDAAVVSSLCATVQQILRTPESVAYIAATLRNQETIVAWERCLEGKLHWTVVSRVENPHCDCKNVWFARGTPEIRVYELRRLA